MKRIHLIAISIVSVFVLGICIMAQGKDPPQRGDGGGGKPGKPVAEQRK